MNFELSEEHEMVRNTVKRFARSDLAKVAERMDTDDYFPDDLFRKMGEIGMLGITIPTEYGGAGLDYISQAICLEELARVSPAFALSVGAHSNLCLDNLFRNGSREQIDSYVPGLATGKLIGCLGLTERESGSDSLAMRTTAKRTGNHFILNGSKTFITNAPVADICLAYAKTSPHLQKKGISAFIVEAASHGFKRGKKFDKMGMRGSPTGELYFDDCSVPEVNLVGSEDGGVSILMSGLNIERAVLASISLGIQDEVLDIAARYAMNRKQFGSPISEFELIQEKIATMWVNQAASRLLMYNAINVLQRKKGRNREAASAILYSAEASTRSALDAIQIMGGNGYMREFIVERMMRDSKLLEIGAGTTEIRKLIIAREVLNELT
jgi:isovaleryl-CoA dehydrogenase